MKLYELDSDAALLREMIEDESGDIDELREALAGLNIERESKLKNLALITLELEGEMEQISEALKRLADLRQSKRKKVEWMRGYMSGSMEAAGEKRIHSPLVDITYQAPRDTVQVTSMGALPQSMIRRPEPQPDKEKIKTALKAGQTVPGAELVPGKPSVRIR